MSLQSGKEGGIGWSYSQGQSEGLDGVIVWDRVRDRMDLQSGREGEIGWSYNPRRRKELDEFIVREG